MVYNDFLDSVGNTPLIKLKLQGLGHINLFAKLEGCNPTGSVKDRAAQFILSKILETGEIDKETLIIESSSGNFGISLSSYCKKLGLKFCCIIDKNISPANETMIDNLSYQVIKITELDENGGYLLNRIRKVKRLLAKTPNAYWVNQYGNPYNAMAYYNTLGSEICNAIPKIDYIFIGVSSGGTITGVSQKIKELSPETKVMAVDTEGSVIFGGKPKKRYIPGIGSSMVPCILKDSKIDEIVTVSEKAAIEVCRSFVKNHSLFIGGSSGSVIAAIYSYFKDKKFDVPPTVVTIFADQGSRYLSTIYNKDWCKEKFNI
ncbi:MAG: 2,3-diaminopropionate biosynthesis protein SbnA [Patescibacteria group bacterium]